MKLFIRNTVAICSIIDISAVLIVIWCNHDPEPAKLTGYLGTSAIRCFDKALNGPDGLAAQIDTAFMN